MALCFFFICPLIFNTRIHAQKIHAVSTSMETYEREFSVQGYHVYKDIWEVAIGEDLEFVHEQNNIVDRYVVVVLKDDTIVGHLLKTSVLLFLKRGGVALQEVEAYLKVYFFHQLNFATSDFWAQFSPCKKNPLYGICSMLW